MGAWSSPQWVFTERQILSKNLWLLFEQKLSLKMDSNSVLAVGPSALRKVGGMSSGPAASFLRMACMALSRRAGLEMAVEEFSFRSGDCSRMRQQHETDRRNGPCRSILLSTINS